jgi:hypothetical protein
MNPRRILIVGALVAAGALLAMAPASAHPATAPRAATAIEYAVIAGPDIIEYAVML